MSGAAWLLRRLVASVAIIFAVVTLVFILIHLAPGEPCPTDEPVDPSVCLQLKQQFGLDRPLPEQYWRYIAALARGNFGYSFSLHRPVRDALAETIPFTLQLGGAALLLDFVLGLLLGIYQASRVNRVADVVIGSVQHNSDVQDAPVDRFAMSYRRVEVSYLPIGADGRPGTPIKTGFDLDRNRPA